MKYLKYLLLILALTLFGWFIYSSDIKLVDVTSNLEKVGFNFIFLILVTFIAQLLATIAWDLSFLDSPPNISIFRLFLIRLVGESIAVINPTNVVAGESFKALMLKREGVDYSTSIASLTLSRFLVVFSLVTLLIFSFFIIINEIQNQFIVISELKQYSIYLTQYGTYIAIVFILLLLSLITLAIYSLSKGYGLISIPFQILHKKFRSTMWIKATYIKLKQVDHKLLKLWKIKKGKAFLAYLLSALHWILGGFEVYLILQFLNVDVSAISVIASEMGVINIFKSLGAFIPFQAGVEETGNQIMLNILGIQSAAIFITVTLLRRLRQFFWIGSGLMILTFFMKKKESITENKHLINERV